MSGGEKIGIIEVTGSHWSVYPTYVSESMPGTPNSSGGAFDRPLFLMKVVCHQGVANLTAKMNSHWTGNQSKLYYSLPEQIVLE